MRIPSFVLAFILALGYLSAPAVIQAQQPGLVQRSIAFFGRVETVDLERKIVVVKHGRVPGYVDSGTTEHSTDGEAVLKRLQAGDDIRATVYPNDLTLYRIQIVYRPGAKGRTSK